MKNLIKIHEYTGEFFSNMSFARHFPTPQNSPDTEAPGQQSASEEPSASKNTPYSQPVRPNMACFSSEPPRVPVRGARLPVLCATASGRRLGSLPLKRLLLL
ncbi:MAG: hypothetical protein MR832_02135, partial [Clostridiales bacterium]|nr:hypothetical protein [Clostridiales bacterium]